MEQDRLHVFNHLLYSVVTACVCHIPHVGPEEHETTLYSGMDRVDTELGDQCSISSFRSNTNETAALLRCYAAQIGNCRRFGIIDRSHLQEASSHDVSRNVCN
jgi:hypothetical protein